MAPLDKREVEEMIARAISQVKKEADKALNIEMLKLSDKIKQLEEERKQMEEQIKILTDERDKWKIAHADIQQELTRELHRMQEDIHHLRGAVREEGELSHMDEFKEGLKKECIAELKEDMIQELDTKQGSWIEVVKKISRRNFKFGEDLADAQSVWSVDAHSESCRALRFGEDGHYVLTASPDCSILATNIETGQSVARLTSAHRSPINRLINLTECTIASGDDDGTIKVWDTRQNKCCNSFSPHEDYISDLEFASSTSQLLGVSGDGTLSVCNLRSNKVEAHSEFSEDELLSVVLVKDGRKVVCGSQEGVLLLYSWPYFKDCSDRFVGHPKSVESILKFDEDTVMTGSSDGLIRLISILPNKMIGVIGEHADFPIERLALCSNRKVLGSASHDHVLKLWDVSYLHERDTNAFEGQASEDHNKTADHDSDVDSDIKAPRRKKSKGNATSASASGFFDELL
ncbi:hypothetical protein L7F22_017199 [Adiantum nelumboides]|nr:hypothetical protein [Adiantum nelumboides]